MAKEIKYMYILTGKIMFLLLVSQVLRDLIIAFFLFTRKHHTDSCILLHLHTYWVQIVKYEFHRFCLDCCIYHVLLSLINNIHWHSIWQWSRNIFYINLSSVQLINISFHMNILLNLKAFIDNIISIVNNNSS